MLDLFAHCEQVNRYSLGVEGRVKAVEKSGGGQLAHMKSLTTGSAFTAVESTIYVSPKTVALRCREPLNDRKPGSRPR